jgi:hypothetical protein
MSASTCNTKLSAKRSGLPTRLTWDPYWSQGYRLRRPRTRNKFRSLHRSTKDQYSVPIGTTRNSSGCLVSPLRSTGPVESSLSHLLERWTQAVCIHTWCGFLLSGKNGSYNYLKANVWRDGERYITENSVFFALPKAIMKIWLNIYM